MTNEIQTEIQTETDIPNRKPGPGWITQADAARILGVSAPTIQYWREVGGLEFKKAGSRIWVQEHQLSQLPISPRRAGNPIQGEEMVKPNIPEIESIRTDLKTAMDHVVKYADTAVALTSSRGGSSPSRAHEATKHILNDVLAKYNLRVVTNAAKTEAT